MKNPSEYEEDKILVSDAGLDLVENSGKFLCAIYFYKIMVTFSNSL